MIYTYYALSAMVMGLPGLVLFFVLWAIEAGILN